MLRLRISIQHEVPCRKLIDDKVRDKIPMSETDEGIPKVYKNWQVNKKSATSYSIS